MAKDTFYFTHDYNARNDIKIKKLIIEHGMKGYGIYWSIVEDLYNNANALPTDYKSIAYDLRVDEKVIESIIRDFGLFVFDNDVFGSTSIEERLEARNFKSVKARESANKRWNKSKGNANALQTECTPNAINKGKEIKERKVNKENSLLKRKNDFKISLSEFLETYGKDMLNNFFRYWTEPNKSKTKMKFELQKTWDIAGRLKYWASNDKTFATKQKTNEPAQKSELVFK